MSMMTPQLAFGSSGDRMPKQRESEIKSQISVTRDPNRVRQVEVGFLDTDKVYKMKRQNGEV